MKISYDHLADALYITFTDKPVQRTQTINPHVNIDVDVDGQMVGLEVLAVQRSGINPWQVITDYAFDPEAVVRPDPDEIEKRRRQRTQSRQQTEGSSDRR